MAAPAKHEHAGSDMEIKEDTPELDPLRAIYVALAKGTEAAEEPDIVDSGVDSTVKDDIPRNPPDVPTSGRSVGGDGRQHTSAPGARVPTTGDGTLGQRLRSLSVTGPGQQADVSREQRRAALREQGKGREQKEGHSLSGSDTESTYRKKRTRKVKNVFTRMEEAQYGPLSILYRAVKERLKVKVWVRSYKHVRGICTGYVAAFDTHWNMAMLDVDELYKPAGPRTKQERKIRVRKKKVAKETTDTGSEAECSRAAKAAENTRPLKSQNTIPVEAQLDGTASLSLSASSDESDETEHLEIQDQVDGPPKQEESKAAEASTSRAGLEEGQECDDGSANPVPEPMEYTETTSEDDQSEVETTESELSQTEDSVETDPAVTDDGDDPDDSDDEETLQQLMSHLTNLKQELSELEKTEEAETKEKERTPKKEKLSKSKGRKEEHSASKADQEKHSSRGLSGQDQRSVEERTKQTDIHPEKTDKKFKSEVGSEGSAPAGSCQVSSEPIRSQSKSKSEVGSEGSAPAGSTCSQVSSEPIRSQSKSKSEVGPEGHAPAGSSQVSSKPTRSQSSVDDQSSAPFDLRSKLRRGRNEKGQESSPSHPSRSVHREPVRRESLHDERVRDTEKYKQAKHSEESKDRRDVHLKSSVKPVSRTPRPTGSRQSGEKVVLKDRTPKGQSSESLSREDFKERPTPRDDRHTRHRKGSDSEESKSKSEKKLNVERYLPMSQSKRTGEDLPTTGRSHRLSVDYREKVERGKSSEKSQRTQRSQEDPRPLHKSASLTRALPGVGGEGKHAVKPTSGVVETRYDVERSTSRRPISLRSGERKVDESGLMRRHANQLFIRGDNIVMVALVTS